LVTGGAGFIGANACNILTAEGYDVTAIDNLALGSAENLAHSVTFIQGDVSRAEDLERAGPVDFIIHMAAASSAPMFATSLQESFVNNVRGHLAVLEFARARAVKKVLFASTSSIYGNNPLPLVETQPVTPPNFYSVSKHCQEEFSHVYNKVYGTEIMGFRFMSVYGLHEEHKGRFANLVSQFIWGMEQGKHPVIYGDGSQTRDFINVRDVVAAFSLALKTPKRFGFAVFNLGTGHAIDMRALAALIGKLMGVDLPPRYIENPVKDTYILAQQADPSRIVRELGFRPVVTLEDGIREIIAYRKRNPKPPASLSY
jgi:UDP-glucose 4-epimerase